MTYYVGDIPSEDLVIEPARNDEPIDLGKFDFATAILRDETGAEVVSAGFLVTFEDGALVVEWPGGNLFTTPGMYSLTVTLDTDDERARERLAPVYVVIQADDGWTTIDALREDWADARSLPDRTLHLLLNLSKLDVLEYAPELEDGERPPINYVRAQADHARNKLNASKVDPASGGFGDETFIIKPFPLDWHITQTLRPKRGIPTVG